MGLRHVVQPLVESTPAPVDGAGQELGEKAAGAKEAGAPAMDGDHVSSFNCYGKITTLLYTLTGTSEQETKGLSLFVILILIR
jgi:hypothetical protein